MFRSDSRRRLAAVSIAVTGSLALAACGGVSGGSDDGADFPSTSITWTIASSPGGSTDLISRAAAEAMEKPLGESFVLENREGANGAIGGKSALGQKADGYNVVMLFQSLLAIGPLTIDDPDAITMEDQDVIGGMTIEDYVLVTAEKGDIDSLEDALAKDSVSFGTSGTGTGSQLAQVLLFSDAGVDYRDVPLDGGAGAVTAALGGQVDVAAVQVGEAAPQIDAGTLVPLAVFSEERIDFLPEVPTAVESGHDIVVDQRRWLAAPKGLPDDVRETLTDALAEANKDEKYLDFLESRYIRLWDASADEVVEQVDTARDTFAALLDSFGVTLQAS